MKNNLHLNEDKLNSFANATVQFNVEKQLRERYARILVKSEIEVEKKETLIQFSSLAKIAAVAIILFGSIFLLQDYLSAPSAKSYAQTFLDQTNIPGNPDITRKGSNSANNLRRIANDAFMLKDYPLAITKYKALKAQNENSSLDQFYLGISHLKTSNFSEAIDLFVELKEEVNFEPEEIGWFLSLTYILTDQESKAKPLLEKILADNGYKAKEAEKLLDAIE